MRYAFPPPATVALPISGAEERFPVRRIFCVGRNYADHAREMGATEQAEGREPPFFFSKPGDAVVGGAGEIVIDYPPATANLHHEMELVVALQAGGANVSVEDAPRLIFGYAAGLDLTRRDMQAKAKEKGHPWDMSKGFDQSAVIGEIHPVRQTGHPAQGRIWLSVNGEVKQDGNLAAMGWKVPEIIANLSTLVALAPGDLIFTGTPAGVGAIRRGDVLEGAIEGVGSIRARFR